VCVVVLLILVLQEYVILNLYNKIVQLLCSRKRKILYSYKSWK